MPSIRVDHRDLQAVYKADGVHPDFAIVEAVIDLFNCRPLKNPHRILERHPMQREITAILVFIPSITHHTYLHNVNIPRKG